MATLILEDGARFEGTLFGSRQPVTGEVIFTTGMCGYQEMMTDPAYSSQIVCMTYPLIGNVGINDLDFESGSVKLAGMIVSELCELPSNWQMKKSLDEFFCEQGVTGMYGVDTRALTRHLRNHGAMRGRIVDGDEADADIEAVLDDYIAFYADRIERGLPVDRPTCPYNAKTLQDRKLIKANMLTNPFEKFERKRFLYHSKDLGVISMNHALFSKMEGADFQRVEEQMREDLEKYYGNL